MWADPDLFARLGRALEPAPRVPPEPVVAAMRAALGPPAGRVRRRLAASAVACVVLLASLAALALTSTHDGVRERSPALVLAHEAAAALDAALDDADAVPIHVAAARLRAQLELLGPQERSALAPRTDALLAAAAAAEAASDGANLAGPRAADPRSAPTRRAPVGFPAPPTGRAPSDPALGSSDLGETDLGKADLGETPPASADPDGAVGEPTPDASPPTAAPTTEASTTTTTGATTTTTTTVPPPPTTDPPPGDDENAAGPGETGGSDDDTAEIGAAPPGLRRLRAVL